MLSNTLSNAGSGTSSICTADNCTMLLPIVSASSNCSYGFIWDPTYNNCVIDCTFYFYATTQANLTACNCDTNYFWYDSNSGCVINCSSIPNAFTEDSSFIYCACDSGYSW